MRRCLPADQIRPSKLLAQGPTGSTFRICPEKDHVSLPCLSTLISLLNCCHGLLTELPALNLPCYSHSNLNDFHFSKDRPDHVTSLLKTCQWLPVTLRIKSKPFAALCRPLPTLQPHLKLSDLIHSTLATGLLATFSTPQVHY